MFDDSESSPQHGTPLPRKSIPRPQERSFSSGDNFPVHTPRNRSEQLCTRCFAWVVDSISSFDCQARVLIVDQRQLLVVNFQTGQISFACLVRNLVSIHSTQVSPQILRLEFSMKPPSGDQGSSLATVKYAGMEVGNKQLALRVKDQFNRDSLLAFLFTHVQAVQLDRTPLHEARNVLARLGTLERPINSVFQLSNVTFRQTNISIGEADKKCTSKNLGNVLAIGLFYPKVFHLLSNKTLDAPTEPQTQPSMNVCRESKELYWEEVYSFSSIQKLHTAGSTIEDDESVYDQMHVCLAGGALWSYRLHSGEPSKLDCIALFLGWVAYSKSMVLFQNNRIQPYIDIEKNSPIFMELGLQPRK